MVGLNHNTEQVRLVDELLQKQNKIKELVSNKNYILWLEEFTKSYPKFCDDDWLYKSDELSDRDTQMISYLGYFYECINQYAEKNYLSAYSDNIPFYNCFYHIKFNAILYKIGIVSGQGTYYYCQRIDEPNFDKCIYFDDILTNKKQDTVSKIEMLSNVVQVLCCSDISPDIIRATVEKTIQETFNTKKQVISLTKLLEQQRK